MAQTRDDLMTIIPPGTYFMEPDDINRVTLMFRSQDDAIIFFEFLKSLGEARASESREK